MDSNGSYRPRPSQPGQINRAQGFFMPPPERKRSYDEYEEIMPVTLKRHLSEAETVFRLLLPEVRLNSVMNGNGDVHLPTGCRMRLCERVQNCGERVIVISAKDDRKDDSNVAMQGLLDAVRRALGAEQTARETSRTPPNPIYMVRLLINRTQAGAVIGKAGSLNKEIRERTGAYSKILTTEDIPLCALHNDRVVQVTGSVEQVMAGMEIIARQLRDNVPKERPGGPPPCLPTLTGFTMYYAHEASPYIPATDFGRPIFLQPPYQIPVGTPNAIYTPGPPAGFMPIAHPSSRPMYNQSPLMYAANQARPPYSGTGPTYYFG